MMKQTLLGADYYPLLKFPQAHSRADSDHSGDKRAVLNFENHIKEGR